MENAAPAALEPTTSAGSDQQQQQYDARGERVAVCVTGATGYVAGHIVKQLLEKGYVVHATCRDPGNAKATRHLLQLPGAGSQLKLFQAELTAAGSFAAAIAGCTYVIHTASPYVIDCQPGQEEELLLKPAIFGTENVLASVNATPTIKAVVITASTAAVFTDATERGPGHVFSEADWNVSATPSRFPYFYSKKVAEQRAYEMCKEAGGRWRLCSINPGAIWGPPLSSRLDSESVSQCIDLLSGVMWPWAANIACGFVDVRDVARAHIAAMERGAARGRYLVNARSLFLLDFALRVLRRAYPARWVPIATGPRLGVLLFAPLLGLPRELALAMMDKPPAIDASKAAADLGMTPESYTEPDATVRDMAAALFAKGMVPARLPVVPGVIAGALLAAVLLGLALALALASSGLRLLP